MSQPDASFTWSIANLLPLIAKMRGLDPDDGVTRGWAALVLDGSPLFTGRAGSGEPEIRWWRPARH